MISDIVCEYMVKRKFNIMQAGQAAFIIVAGVLVSDIIASLVTFADPSRVMFFALLLCGLGLTAFFARFALIVEYEYSFVNGELTVDRILARSRRKHMLDVNVKTIHKLGYFNKSGINEHGIDTVKDFSSCRTDEDTVFACYKDESTGKNVMLLFTPNQKMIDAMKPYVSATVYREAFSKTDRK